jgi:hypothetical protein
MTHITITNIMGLWSMVGIFTIPVLIGVATLIIERRREARRPKVPADLLRAWAARDEWKM